MTENTGGQAEGVSKIEEKASPVDLVVKEIELHSKKKDLPDMNKPNAEQILRKRAEDLARFRAEGIEVEETTEYLIFTISENTFAVETRWLKGVYGKLSITEIPNTPGFILGIITVHGRISSIVDLPLLLQMGGNSGKQADNIVLLENREMTFGFPANSIRTIREIPESRILASSSQVRSSGEALIKGITEDNIIILDGDKILKNKAFVVE